MTATSERAVVATATDTVELAEVYAHLTEQATDGRVQAMFAERVSELNTLGLGLLAEQGEGGDGLRSRLDEAADRAYEAAGLDGAAGR